MVIRVKFGINLIENVLVQTFRLIEFERLTLWSIVVVVVVAFAIKIDGSCFSAIFIIIIINTWMIIIALQSVFLSVLRQ